MIKQFVQFLKRWVGRIGPRQQSLSAPSTITPEAEKAHEERRRLDAHVTADIDIMADQILIDPSRNSLAVLAGRTETIRPVKDLPYADEARIELQVMIRNWSERLTHQRNEIWMALAAKWGEEHLTWSKAEVDILIGAAVDRLAILLAADGMERTAEAMQIDSSRSKGSTIDVL